MIHPIRRLHLKGDWKKACLLVAVASLLAVAVNAFRPEPLPWVIDPAKSTNPGENPELKKATEISLEELSQQYEQGLAIMVDARKAVDYEAGHVAGAVSVPADEKENYLDTIFESLPFGMTIVIYCEGGECEASHIIYEFLLANGFEKEFLRIFYPGWEVLRKEESGLPREGGLPR